MGITPETDSDCEVIVHLYKRYGIEQTLTMLDGVFAFILCDYSNSKVDDVDLTSKIYVARDPYGVRPLYFLNHSSLNIFGFASELKCLNEFHLKYNDIKSTYTRVENEYKIEQFTPGTYSEFVLSNLVMANWKPVKSNIPYHIPSFSYTVPSSENDELRYCKGIQEMLVNAVNKRCITTERPVACLLSGGLDSSLITALVNEFQKTHTPDKPLETYSIGLKGSVDLLYARKVADYLKTNHTEILVTE